MRVKWEYRLDVGSLLWCISITNVTIMYYAYVRASTARQANFGVSIPAQKDAITRCASRHQLSIAAWFEEHDSAASRGRAVFNDMLQGLRRGQAEGVLIHKIDRGARNLRDWSDIGELIDRGIDVRFVSEDTDLRSRAGRLSADIQAVVASDFWKSYRRICGLRVRGVNQTLRHD